MSASTHGRGEIEAAKQRLLVAKKWVASAKKQLLTAKMEEQEAEKFLKTIEDKYEVTYVDSGDEKEEDDDNNKQTKGTTTSKEREEEVGRKRQRSTLPPQTSSVSVETSTLFAGEINHGDTRGSGQYEPNPYRPRTELLTPVMVNHTQTGQPYLPFRLILWSSRIER